MSMQTSRSHQPSLIDQKPTSPNNQLVLSVTLGSRNIDSSKRPVKEKRQGQRIHVRLGADPPRVRNRAGDGGAAGKASPPRRRQWPVVSSEAGQGHTLLETPHDHHGTGATRRSSVFAVFDDHRGHGDGGRAGPGVAAVEPDDSCRRRASATRLSGTLGGGRPPTSAAVAITPVTSLAGTRGVRVPARVATGSIRSRSRSFTALWKYFSIFQRHPATRTSSVTVASRRAASRVVGDLIRLAALRRASIPPLPGRLVAVGLLPPRADGRWPRRRSVHPWFLGHADRRCHAPGGAG